MVQHAGVLQKSRTERFATEANNDNKHLLELTLSITPEIMFACTG